MLDSGAFASEADLAAALGIDKSNVNRTLDVLELPEELTSRIIDNHAISSRQASRFMSAWRDPNHQALLATENGVDCDHLRTMRDGRLLATLAPLQADRRARNRRRDRPSVAVAPEPAATGPADPILRDSFAVPRRFFVAALAPNKT